MAPPEVRCASYDGSSYNQPHSTNGIWAPSERAPSGELDQRTQQLSLSYLFGPGWLLTGTHALLVMVQRLLLQGPLLLPLMLEGNQVVPLLLQLPLKSFRLPLLFQLLALVLLPRAGGHVTTCNHSATLSISKACSGDNGKRETNRIPRRTQSTRR